MRIVFQRAFAAEVSVDGHKIAQTKSGAVIFVGIAPNDAKETVDLMLEKVINLRVFEDDKGKMNRSLIDVGGDLMILPNFTLYGDARTGRRPSFTGAAKPELSAALFSYMVAASKKRVLHIGSGQFGADMKISIINDGPVTILLDSDKLF